jgi:hypothetical protein
MFAYSIPAPVVCTASSHDYGRLHVTTSYVCSGRNLRFGRLTQFQLDQGALSQSTPTNNTSAKSATNNLSIRSNSDSQSLKSNP